MTAPRISETESAVVLEPPGTATGAVIWLHGLGADGHDFVPIVPELGLADHALRFVFPHAPERPVTINGGMRMRAWYDIPTLDRLHEEDADGIRASAQALEGLLRHQIGAGIAANRMVLAGFSQGGAITLHTGLRYRRPLAGLLALSTYLPLAGTLADEAHDANHQTPILMCHGRADPMLPFSMGEASRDQLQAAGYAVEWRDYPMQHQVCVEEIADIAAWLRARFTPV